MGIILKPFAWLLLVFYNFAGYAVALMLFALVTKTILFPVTLKSKKSMIQTTMLSGKMQQLQKMYGKNPERYNLEVQKLYEKEHINPMGGCLWSLIPMIVLILLYGIIREPITNFMNLTAVQIQQMADYLDWQNVAVAKGWMTQAAMDKLVQQVADGKLKHIFQNGSFNQIYLLTLVNEGNLAALRSLIGSDSLFVMDFTFLGIDLSAIPNWMFWKNGITWNSIGLFLLPLISTAISFLSMKVSMATNKINNQSAGDQVEKSNKMMMLMMPLMSLWIGFTLPAGLCIYWIAQYLVSMVQEVICSRLLKKDYEAARLAAEERERQEKEDEKKRKEEARLERARRAEEEKKNRGKKKPKKPEGPAPDGVNREDSREGIRAYARGRAYIPDRFGGVTPYRDPNGPAPEKPEDSAPTPEEEKTTAPELSEAETSAALPEDAAPKEERTEEEAPEKEEEDQSC